MQLRADELRGLSDQLVGYQMSLDNAKGSLKDLRSRMMESIQKKSQLNRQEKKHDTEMDDMYSKFEQVTSELKKRANYKNEVLE